MGEHYDVIIIGTGAGGGTLARHLAPSGKRILMLERGDWLPREPANWSTVDVFVDGRYVSKDSWYDPKRKSFFQPQVHYFVGGATKLYGAALYRLRAEDFGELRHHDGLSPAWPISYQDMEPYYTAAEQMYEVHGARGEDPTDPPASGPYPYPAVSHEPRIQQLSDDLAKAGHHPFHAHHDVGCVLWTAGVEAPPVATTIAKATGAKQDRAGRIMVNDDCTIPGHPEIYVTGDVMSLDKLPGVAEVAMQSGLHAGNRIRHAVAGDEAIKAFRYRDLGSAAYISCGKAVVSVGRLHLSGFIAWWIWLFIHIGFLTGYRNRLGAMPTWWFAFTRDLRRERTFTTREVGFVPDVHAARLPTSATATALPLPLALSPLAG